MRFELSASAFRNIHKFSPPDMLDYLDPLLRDLAWNFRDKKNTRVPPLAFIFGKEQGVYLSGYEFSTPDSFKLQCKQEAKQLKASVGLLCVEVGSVAIKDSEALLVTEVQFKDKPYLRCAYDLLKPGRLPVSEGWALPSAKPASPFLDPIDQMIENASNGSVILGPALFFDSIF